MNINQKKCRMILKIMNLFIMNQVIFLKNKNLKLWLQLIVQVKFK